MCFIKKVLVVSKYVIVLMSIIGNLDIFIVFNFFLVRVLVKVKCVLFDVLVIRMNSINVMMLMSIFVDS